MADFTFDDPVVPTHLYVYSRSLTTNDLLSAKVSRLKWLALFSIQQTDLTSFSEDGRGVKWLCN
jgi:hypothetical protein